MEETGASTSQFTREESLEEKKVRVGISDLNVYQKVIIIPLTLAKWLLEFLGIPRNLFLGIPRNS